MNPIPARAGWQWIVRGAALFRQQPAELATLVFAYLFLLLGLSIIPILGQIVPAILVPAFSMAFMQACVEIEQGRRVYPNLLLVGFRSPAVRSLLLLGVLYMLAAMLVMGVSMLIEGGVLIKLFSGDKDLDEEAMRNAGLALLLVAVVYTPVMMGFWFAAPLVAWKKMGVGKALFFSFFAVKRAGKAFLVYGLAWALILTLLPAFITGLVSLLTDSALAAAVLLMPLSVGMVVAMYCSFYPMYRDIFGDDDSDKTAIEEVSVEPAAEMKSDMPAEPESKVEPDNHPPA